MTGRGFRFALVFGGVVLMRALHFAQARDRVTYAPRQLLYGLYAAARRRTQLFAQQQLGLAYDTRQRVVNLVPHVGHKLRYLYQLRFVLSYERTQVFIFRLPRFATLL
jgi:hypothetical protein